MMSRRRPAGTVALLGYDIPVANLVAFMVIGAFFALRYIRRRRDHRGHGSQSPAAAGQAGAASGRPVAASGAAGGARAESSARQASASAGSGRYAGMKALVVVDTLDLQEALSSIPANASSTVAMLQSLQSQCKQLLLLCRIAASEEEPVFQQTLELAKLLGVPRHCVLACKTDKGMESIARQLVPGILIIGHETIASFLSKFIDTVVLIRSSMSASSGPVKTAGKPIKVHSSFLNAAAELLA